jgi:hypothetical protein
MDREATDALRHDRRLAHRRGWISDKDAQAAAEALPDAASKAMTLGEASDAKDEPESAAPAPPALPQP